MRRAAAVGSIARATALGTSVARRAEGTLPPARRCTPGRESRAGRRSAASWRGRSRSSRLGPANASVKRLVVLPSQVALRSVRHRSAGPRQVRAGGTRPLTETTGDLAKRLAQGTGWLRQRGHAVASPRFGAPPAECHGSVKRRARAYQRASAGQVAHQHRRPARCATARWAISDSSPMLPRQSSYCRSGLPFRRTLGILRSRARTSREFGWPRVRHASRSRRLQAALPKRRTTGPLSSYLVRRPPVARPVSAARSRRVSTCVPVPASLQQCPHGIRGLVDVRARSAEPAALRLADGHERGGRRSRESASRPSLPPTSAPAIAARVADRVEMRVACRDVRRVAHVPRRTRWPSEALPKPPRSRALQSMSRPSRSALARCATPSADSRSSRSPRRGPAVSARLNASAIAPLPVPKIEHAIGASRQRVTKASSAQSTSSSVSGRGIRTSRVDLRAGEPVEFLELAQIGKRFAREPGAAEVAQRGQTASSVRHRRAPAASFVAVRGQPLHRGVRARDLARQPRARLSRSVDSVARARSPSAFGEPDVGRHRTLTRRRFRAPPAARRPAPPAARRRPRRGRRRGSPAACRA